MTLAMKQYIGMSNQMRIIIFEEAAKRVLRTVLRELMPTLEELQQNVLHLDTMRGASTQNISVSFVLSQLNTYVASQNDIAKLFQAQRRLEKPNSEVCGAITSNNE